MTNFVIADSPFNHRRDVNKQLQILHLCYDFWTTCIMKTNHSTDFLCTSYLCLVCFPWCPKSRIYSQCYPAVSFEVVKTKSDLALIAKYNRLTVVSYRVCSMLCPSNVQFRTSAAHIWTFTAASASLDFISISDITECCDELPLKHYVGKKKSSKIISFYLLFRIIFNN